MTELSAAVTRGGSPPVGGGCGGRLRSTRWGYAWSMRPIRWIIGTSVLGLGTALMVTRRELEEERRAHKETVLALETIKQVATPRSDA